MVVEILTVDDGETVDDKALNVDENPVVDVGLDGETVDDKALNVDENPVAGVEPLDVSETVDDKALNVDKNPVVGVELLDVGETVDDKALNVDENPVVVEVIGTAVVENVPKLLKNTCLSCRSSTYRSFPAVGTIKTRPRKISHEVFNHRYVLVIAWCGVQYGIYFSSSFCFRHIARAVGECNIVTVTYRSHEID